ncbi:MAG TPA: hypothetical protein VKX34_05730 [Aequorivita sp.]|nr:hypothetical protein [Aequorivita sp.]
MIEEFLGKLKSEVGGQISGQTDVSSSKMDGIFSVVGDVVKKEATKEMLGGNISGLMDLFSDKPNSASGNQIQSNMFSGIVSDLVSKLGLSKSQSQTITEIALPALISMISKKSSGSSKDTGSVLTDMFGGDDKGGIGGMAKDLLGGFLK